MIGKIIIWDLFPIVSVNFILIFLMEILCISISIIFFMRTFLNGNADYSLVYIIELHFNSLLKLPNFFKAIATRRGASKISTEKKTM